MTTVVDDQMREEQAKPLQQTPIPFHSRPPHRATFQQQLQHQMIAFGIQKARELFRGSWGAEKDGEARFTISLSGRELLLLLFGIIVGVTLGLAASSTDEQCDPTFPLLASWRDYAWAAWVSTVERPASIIFAEQAAEAVRGEMGMAQAAAAEEAQGIAGRIGSSLAGSMASGFIACASAAAAAAVGLKKQAEVRAGA